MKLSFTILFLFFTLFLFSQNADTNLSNVRVKHAFLSFEPYVDVNFPVFDFQEKINESVVLGKSIAVFGRSKKYPIDVGIRFSDIPYHKISRVYVDSFDNAEIVQKSKSKVWNIMAVLRFEPKVKFPLQPFIEGSFGANRFFTKTFSRENNLVITDDNINPRFDEANLISDWGIGYGAAVGTTIVLEKTYNTALNVQAGFQSSTLGRYFVKNEVDEVLENPPDNFTERSGSLSVFFIRIGLSVLLFEE